MYKLMKFYPAGFNPQLAKAERYSSVRLAGRSSDEYRQQDFWPLLEANLKKSERYLDAGCGLGGWIIFLSELGYQMEGADATAQAVRSLAEYDPALKVKIAEITALPYPDQYFAGVLAIGTMEYTEDRVQEALLEMQRVLQPNGLLFIEVPVINWLRRWFYIPIKKIEKLIKKRRGANPVFSHYLFNLEEMKTMLDKTGFRVASAIPHDLPGQDSHFGLYIDWRILRGKKPYQLNTLGLVVKKISNITSPWMATTGMVIAARKK